MKDIRTLVGTASMAGLLGSQACGLPPPWEIEVMKVRQAELVVVAEVGQVSTIEGVPHADRVAILQARQVLKGELPAARPEDGKASCGMAFAAVAQFKEGETVEARTVGGPVAPDVQTGDVALVFLRGVDGHAGLFRLVAGAFGYIRLSRRPDEDGKRVAEVLERHRAWCARIEDAGIRQALETMYIKAANPAVP